MINPKWSCFVTIFHLGNCEKWWSCVTVSFTSTCWHGTSIEYRIRRIQNNECLPNTKYLSLAWNFLFWGGWLPFLMSLSLFFFYSIICIQSLHVIHAVLTRDESKHVGQEFIPPPIYNEFDQSKYKAHPSLLVNDYHQHHQLIYKFCSSRKEENHCTWSEYYSLLDKLRTPYENLFDPKPSPVESLADIQRDGKSGMRGKQTKCDVISKPTAEILFEYVKNSKPVCVHIMYIYVCVYYFRCHCYCKC